ncbi:MAG: L-fucose/L-arabinose isomerase family protein [Planctomycetes bacterium]|nr:L-fucose/L-arabinose isomerase family protein [Planctomycetota bacterium]
MVPARRKPLTARIGTYAVGLDVYWPQFPGLLDKLMGWHGEFIGQVRAHGVEVVDFGMVDNAAGAQALLPRVKAADIDLLFVDMVTYATSATFGVIARALDVPIVLVALQPMRCMDYDRATTFMQLCNDNICAMPEFCNAMVRMGRKAPPTVIGTLHDDAQAAGEIARWVRVARVLHDVKRARLGHFGHPLEAMYDMHTDQTALTGTFGLHVVQTEIDDLARLERGVTEAEIAAKSAEILGMFDTPTPEHDPHTEKLTEKDLRNAAKGAVALDRFIAETGIDGLAYYYKGENGGETQRLASSLIVGNSLLCAAGFPMCGESDLKTCVAMMIMDRLDIGGSFAEFHPVDFASNSVLVGHDGPHHIRIADGKPVIRSLKQYHGKPGSGASVEFQIAAGPMTMLGLTSQADGSFKFVVAEGESRRGKIPATGNTNTHGHFGSCVRTFLSRWFAEGPTHHFALGVGHHAEDLRLVGEAMGIETVIVRGV